MKIFRKTLLLLTTASLFFSGCTHKSAKTAALSNGQSRYPAYAGTEGIYTSEVQQRRREERAFWKELTTDLPRIRNFYGRQIVRPDLVDVIKAYRRVLDKEVRDYDAPLSLDDVAEMCRQTVESQTCTSVPEEERLSCAHIREGEEGRTKAKATGVAEGAKNVFVEMGKMVGSAWAWLWGTSVSEKRVQIERAGLAVISASGRFSNYLKGEYFQKRSEEDEVTFRTSVIVAGKTAGETMTIVGTSMSDMMENVFMSIVDTYACKNTKHRARYAGAVVGEVGFEVGTNVALGAAPLVFSVFRRGFIFAHKKARALSEAADTIPELKSALRHLEDADDLPKNYTLIFRLQNDLIPDLIILKRGSDELAEGYFASSNSLVGMRIQLDQAKADFYAGMVRSEQWIETDNVIKANLIKARKEVATTTEEIRQANIKRDELTKKLKEPETATNAHEEIRKSLDAVTQEIVILDHKLIQKNSQLSDTMAQAYDESIEYMRLADFEIKEPIEELAEKTILWHLRQTILNLKTLIAKKEDTIRVAEIINSKLASIGLADMVYIGESTKLAELVREGLIEYYKGKKFFERGYLIPRNSSIAREHLLNQYKADFYYMMVHTGKWTETPDIKKKREEFINLLKWIREKDNASEFMKKYDLDEFVLNLMKVEDYEHDDIYYKTITKLEEQGIKPEVFKSYFETERNHFLRSDIEQDLFHAREELTNLQLEEYKKFKERGIDRNEIESMKESESKSILKDILEKIDNFPKSSLVDRILEKEKLFPMLPLHKNPEVKVVGVENILSKIDTTFNEKEKRRMIASWQRIADNKTTGINDKKPDGDGVFSIRDVAPTSQKGARMYYFEVTIDKEKVAVMINAGNKTTQAKDILDAKKEAEKIREALKDTVEKLGLKLN